MEQKLIRKVLQIEGMTCTSCERKIENNLKELAGVVEVSAMFSSSNVYVTYDANVTSLVNVIEAIEKLDYIVKNNPIKDSTLGKRGVKTKANDKMPVNQLIGVGIILLALYVIIKNTVGFNFIPQVNQNMGFGILFVVGLLTSLHCIAMCGGINLSQCVSYQAVESKNKVMSKMKPSLLYNAGRVISYTVIGGVVGALGAAVSFSGTAKGIVAILSGVFMVIMGINMLNLFPWLRKLNPRMPKIFGKRLQKNQGKYGPFCVGIVNGLMPCGPLQAMQIYALGTGSFLAGAGAMFFFSLGTVPLMFGFGAISSLLSGKFTRQMMKVSAVLIMVLGLIMLNRGLNLSGVNGVYASPITSVAIGNVAKIESNVQLVTTKLESGRYPQFTVQKGVPVKWTMQVDEKDLNGCNRTLTIPQFDKTVKLKPGDNIIEFTPTEEGAIRYTCWMGMISSRINVVSDVTQIPEDSTIQSTDQGTTNGASTGGCCGG